MVIINYNKKKHKEIIHACVLALKKGKVVAFPTDTSYGLGVDVSNIKAIKQLYKVKGRDFKKPSSVVVPSRAYAKQIVSWNLTAEKLAKKFWPGPLTIVSELKVKSKKLKVITAGTEFLGLRMPKNKIAMDLTKLLKSPITATSANVSGQPDCYSALEIVEQYKSKKLKPDILLSVGRIPKRKPSTLVKIENHQVDILRLGPVSEKQIHHCLVSTK